MLLLFLTLFVQDVYHLPVNESFQADIILKNAPTEPKRVHIVFRDGDGLPSAVTYALNGGNVRRAVRALDLTIDPDETVVVQLHASTDNLPAVQASIDAVIHTNCDTSVPSRIAVSTRIYDVSRDRFTIIAPTTPARTWQLDAMAQTGIIIANTSPTERCTCRSEDSLRNIVTLNIPAHGRRLGVLDQWLSSGTALLSCTQPVSVQGIRDSIWIE